jgi:LysR family transcriptional activator of nhaA
MNSLRRLNFKHLRYFLEVARFASISKAARALHVAPQTISAQIHELEEAVGQALFERSGRGLALTPAGNVAQDYAASIFSMGEELAAVLTARGQPRSQTLRIGITDSVPKQLTVMVLAPVLQEHRERVELICREGPLALLAGHAAAHELDAVLADAPVPPTLARSLQSRLLMSSGLSFLASRPLRARLARGFPACLEQAPLLTGSGPDSPLAQALAMWLLQKGIAVRIAGRFDDSALMKCFAREGLGIIAVPTTIESEVAAQHGLVALGSTTEVSQSLFLIRPRRHRPHALVAGIEARFPGAATHAR